jgi:hypothetical protein
MRVFDNRVLRKICGPKREELTGEWRKLYTEEIHDVYFSQNIWVYKYIYLQRPSLVKLYRHSKQEE